MEKMRFIIVKDEQSGREVYVEKILYDKSDNLDDYFLRYGPDSSTLDYIRNRPDIDEVIDFANKVRKAGGADIIDSLMPSIPENPDSCLVANALNFNCAIEPDIDSQDDVWQMYFVISGKNEIEVEQKAMDIASVVSTETNPFWHIAEKNYWEDGNFRVFVSVPIPENIKNFAKAFDSYVDVELEQYNAKKNKDRSL